MVITIQKKYIATGPELHSAYLAFTDPGTGETAADNRYLLSEGGNLADMMLGRLAVNNAYRQIRFIDKIIA